MGKQAAGDSSNAALSQQIAALAQKIDDLAIATSNGFTAMQEQSEREHAELRAESQREHAELRAESQREHAELRAESQREHEEIRSLVADKADLYEVVKHPDFDRLEQRVTQLELK